jgi:hypothetical protein
LRSGVVVVAPASVRAAIVSEAVRSVPETVYVVFVGGPTLVKELVGTDDGAVVAPSSLASPASVGAPSAAASTATSSTSPSAA